MPACSPPHDLKTDMIQILFLAMLCGYSFGALAALAGGRSTVGRGLGAAGAVVGAGAGLALGAIIIIAGRPYTLVFSSILPLTGVALRLDGLGAFFLVVIGLLGVAAALYGFGYSAGYTGRYSLGLLGAMFNLLLLALSVQVMADNALTFLIAWEGMSLAAYWLVLTEHDQPGTVRAGVWYIAMTHAGFAALLAMFLLLSAGEITTSFTAMRAGAAALTPLARDGVFLLALFGFGAISALLGVLYALMEHDLKRLLAYHSVENIGIILIGIGAGLIFHTYGLMPLAALGFIGAL